MQPIIHTEHLSKRYGSFTALNDINLDIPKGRFIGLIGPNGAGKTTLLKALLGLGDYQGEVNVLGFKPYQQRHRLMEHACFIADVAVLPGWIRVEQLTRYLDAVHPHFNAEKMRFYLSKTKVKPEQKIKQLSKGMVTQVHLAVVMAIDVPLLVLDEPTIGLDILYRKEFYAHLLEEYFDEGRTIIVSTHQAEEIEHLLTHLMFIQDGNIILNTSMDELSQEYTEVIVNAGQVDNARSLKPLNERQLLGKHIFLYQNKNKQQLEKIGELNIPSISDLFVAMMKRIEQ